MFDAVLEGRIKVLWIAATNPAQSLPDQATRAPGAAERAEFVIVQEAYAGAETLAYADLVLPAATWPEKDGTSDQLRAAHQPGARRRAAAGRCAARLAAGGRRGAPRLARIAPEKAALFDYADEADRVRRARAPDPPAATWTTARSTTRTLETCSPQWPPDAAARARRGSTPTGAFPTPAAGRCFVEAACRPVAEAVSAHFPLRPTTGRLRDHWHTMSRTSLSPALVRHVEEPWISLHPLDMRRLKLADDALAKVRSKRGTLVLPARADDGLKPGHAFLPMHWGSAFMAGDGVNALANPACDPVSHQPELKHSAVSVTPAALPWRAEGWVGGDAAALRRRLAPWLARFAYAVLLPAAVGGGGLRLRLAAAEAPPRELLDALAADLDHDEPRRRLRRPGARRAAPGRPARGQAASLPAGRRHAGADRPAGLGRRRARARRPVAPADGQGAVAARARTVCACMGVSDAAIAAGIREGLDLDGLKSRLGCGTGCGSCVPEIRGMLLAVRA